MIRKFLLGLAILVPALLFLFISQNSASKEMTFKQKILRSLYPVISAFSGKESIRSPGAAPATSFYGLSAIENDGSNFDFSRLRGKKVLIVNTASDCGYTGQYAELQKLYERDHGKLIIIAFPANDFKEQEKGDDETISQFCKLNYGISFPLMKKSVVIRSTQQNDVFKWLTDKNKNGWNDKVPEWNFSKYLVNERGELTHYFSPGVSPLGKEVAQALKP